MAVSPRTLLESANTLLQGGEEIDHRNAASRAYYAAYHACRALADEGGLPSYADTGTHRALIDALTGSRNNTCKGVGFLLRQCRKYRVAADYKIDEDFPEYYARSILAKSYQIFTKLRK